MPTDTQKQQGDRIDPAQYPKILAFLNNPPASGGEPIYGDGMDAILAAKINEKGDIIAIGQDGAKMLAINITDTGVAIKLANYDDLVQQPGAASFAQYPIGQERIISSLKSAGDEAIGGWLDQIKDMLLTADDLGTAKEAIFELFPDLDGGDFGDEVANHLTLAGLAGYFSAEDELNE